MSFYDLIESSMMGKYINNPDLWSQRQIDDIHAVRKLVTVYMCARFVRQQRIELKEAA